jgi:hypothetical protein
LQEECANSVHLPYLWVRIESFVVCAGMFTKKKLTLEYLTLFKALTLCST